VAAVPRSKEFAFEEFIEAAMREPRPRRKVPFPSMYWMSFRPTADEYWGTGPWVQSAGNGRFTAVQHRRVEPGITYDAAETARVCLAAMDRLGVPSPGELRSQECHRLDGSSGRRESRAGTGRRS
jgi:hypothetical protein